MSCAAGPDIKEDGLVLALDVANRKTFANSVINSTSWSLGSGSATGYSQNGATAENERVTGTDPFGRSATVWETRPTGTTDADGGWNSDWFNIDSTKLHRFSVWVKRTTSTSGGTFYLGLYGNNGIKRTDNSVVEGNPYWDCRGTGGFVQDVWYLVVGHCYPYDTTYTGQHPESGIYTVAGGTTKVASINACNIGADVKWAGIDVTQTIHRCYHYYCADSTTRLQLFDPRIDVIGGTEPSIANLLSGFTANRLTDLIGTNNGTFVNGPTYSSANGGSLVFDGSNDFMQANVNTTALDGDPTFSVDMFIRRRTGTNIGPNQAPWGIGGEGQGNGVGGWTPTTNLINLDFYDSTRLASTEYYPEGQFVHIAWTKNGAGAETSNVKCYVNGIERALTKTRDATRTNQFNTSTNGVGIVLGRLNGNSGNFHAPVDVASFKVYTRALSAAEVSQNYNALRGRYGL